MVRHHQHALLAPINLPALGLVALVAACGTHPADTFGFDAFVQIGEINNHVCGNGIVEEHEECDGHLDAACPGRCTKHCACPVEIRGSNLEIHIIDVGQGDAILVSSPHGIRMLLDAGKESHADQVITYLRNQGIEKINYTLVSHMHRDHVGGMDVVLHQYPDVVACFDHGGTYWSSEFLEYDQVANNRRRRLKVGDEIDLGPSVQAQVLHAHSNASSENNNSVVIRIQYNTTKRHFFWVEIAKGNVKILSTQDQPMSTKFTIMDPKMQPTKRCWMLWVRALV